MTNKRAWILSAAVAAAAFGSACEAWGTDIPGIMPAALDQPRINLLIRRTPDSAPLEFEGTFNVEAFYDTGASGILLSNDTTDLLGINRATTSTGDYVLFEDVGVAGTDQFHVSEPLYISLAKYHPDINQSETGADPSLYTQSFGPIRTQVGPISGEPDPLLAGLDVVGIPAMAHKVVVIDPRPVNTFFDTMRTYVYNPGTPYNAATELTDPGIPATTRHIKLTYSDFSRFTRTTPSTEPGPTMSSNPFIGPDPIAKLDHPGDPIDPSTPGITITHNGHSSTGSWLFDTGAAASIISKAQAEAVGVTYVPGTFGTDAPVLQGVPVDDQFTLTIGGIGGTNKLAGFFLDSMLVRTQEGDPLNDSDPNHLNFLRAPVLVGDITLQNPTQPTQTLTLDGILGMNFLVATAFVTEGIPFPTIDQLTIGRFDWITFDHDAGILGLTPSNIDGTQTQITWVGSFWDVLNGDPSEWDIDTSANFLTGMTLGGYKDGDYVLFSDNTLNSKVHIAEPVAPGSVTIDNSQQNYTFTGEAIRGFTGLTKKGSGQVTFRNSNTYTGSTNILAGSVVYAAPQDIGPVNVAEGATLAMQTSQRFEELIVAGTANMPAGGDKLLVTRVLEVTGNGRFDVADNAVVVHAAADTRDAMLTEIGQMIGRARNSGTAGRWSGPGLTSSTVALDPLMGLAAIPNDSGDGTPLMPTFHGETVDVNSILIQYAWNGDTDLDGVIGAIDYQRIDYGFAHGLGTWLWGDFDHSGTVDANDYFLMDKAFLYLSRGGGQWGAAVTVPEPALAAWGILAGLLLRRTRRPH